MLARSQLLRRYRQTGAMNGLLNLYGFLDDQVFLTKSGDVGVVLAVTGVDYEGLEPAQRDGVARRFESALRLLDDRFRLLQYLIKQRGPTIPAESHPDPVIDGALRDRQHFLEARRPDLYDLDLFFVVLYEGAGRRRSLVDRATEAVRHPRAALADWLSTARTLTLVDDDLERARQQLLTKVEAFVVQLEDTVAPRVLGKAEAFGFFRRLLNYRSDKAGRRRLSEDTFLDAQVADSALECHRGVLRLDDDYVQVLTLKDPPSRTYAHLLQGLYEVPANFIAVSEWHREEPGAIRREIQAKRRHFHNSKASLTNYLNSDPTAPAGSAHRRGCRRPRLRPRCLPAGDRAARPVLRRVFLQRRAVGRGPDRLVAERRRLSQGVRDARRHDDGGAPEPPERLAGDDSRRQRHQPPLPVSPQHQLRGPVVPVLAASGSRHESAPPTRVPRHPGNHAPNAVLPQSAPPGRGPHRRARGDGQREVVLVELPADARPEVRPLHGHLRPGRQLSPPDPPVRRPRHPRRASSAGPSPSTPSPCHPPRSTCSSCSRS